MDVDPIRKATAATLRQVAGWGLSFDNGPAASELTQIAVMVEHLDPDIDICCPVCEEVDCDSDCPLAPIRGQR